MSAVIVARFKNKRDANTAIEFLRKLRSEVKLMKEEDWDDYYLRKMIDEGLKDKKEVPLDKIHKKLRR